jgi:hypothetical protein
MVFDFVLSFFFILVLNVVVRILAQGVARGSFHFCDFGRMLARISAQGKQWQRYKTRVVQGFVTMLVISHSW